MKKEENQKVTVTEVMSTGNQCNQGSILIKSCHKCACNEEDNHNFNNSNKQTERKRGTLTTAEVREDKDPS